MPLEFNVGEISRRARTAMSVRGRIPLDLDERVGLSVNALDLDKAPFRQAGSRVFGFLQSSVPGAGNVANLFIESTDPQVTTVIDTLQISGGVAGGAFATLQVQVVPGVGLLCFNPELTAGRVPSVIADTISRGPLSIRESVTAPPTLNSANSFAAYGVVVGTPVPFGVEITIPAGWGLRFEFQILAQSLFVGYTGRIFSGLAAAGA